MTQRGGESLPSFYVQVTGAKILCPKKFFSSYPTFPSHLLVFLYRGSERDPMKT